MSVCKQTVMGPKGRCIVVGGRTHKRYIDLGLMTEAQTIKEVAREAVMAQKSPVKVASPKRKVAVKKTKSPNFAAIAKKAQGEKRLQKVHKKVAAAKKVSPKKVSPKKVASPKRVASPKKVSPKKLASPKKASPKKVSPKKIKRASPKKAARVARK